MKKITPICSKCYPPKWMGAKWYHRFFTRIGIYRYHRWCNGCNSTIIIKQKKNMKEYWMFTLFHSDAVGENALFDRFPSREDLLTVCGGEEYLIIHTMQLTEEQYYKLGGKKFAEEQL